jgi:polyisoprenoid-binding protein YceI
MSIKWKIDPAHSEIQFKVKHLLTITLTGHFRKFDLEVETETDDFDTTKKIEFTAEINSIETNNEERDAQLKSADFFNASAFPQLHFSSAGYKSSGGTLQGNLTIRGVTRPITFDVAFSGIEKDPYGPTKADLSLEGKLNRKDFGLVWPAAPEAGFSVAMSEEVKIHAEVQLVKQG